MMNRSFFLQVRRALLAVVLVVGFLALVSPSALAVFGSITSFNNMRVVPDDRGTETPSSGEDMSVQDVDFGDAPDPTYPTMAASGGPLHLLGSGLLLGAIVDPEPDGQPDATATGDDLAGVPDDEDGLLFTSPLVPGNIANITVTSSLPGLLDGWVDFDNDGSWAHPGEQVFASQPLVPGPNSVSFPVPAAATLGAQTFSRFRLSSAGGLTPTGLAPDGEVEDYALGSIKGQKFEDLNDNGLRDFGEPGLNGVVIELYDATGSNLLATATTMDKELDGSPGIDPVTESGLYLLPGLPPEWYVVREKPESALVQTYPSQLGSNEYDVSLKPGQVLGVAPAEAEVTCGPGPHWVDECGTPYIDSFFDVFFSVAKIELQSESGSPVGAYSESVFGAGETTVVRSEPRESGTPGHLDTIDTEILAMDLVGRSPMLGTLRVRAGVEAGVFPSSPGVIQELGDPFWVESFFDVFFELDTELGTLHNEVPMRMQADIAQVPPYLVGYQSLNPVELFDAAGGPTGIFVTDALHIPTFGADFGNAGLDFGDAPDPTYATLLASNGPRHTLGSGLFLGASVDTEPDGQPNATATGDDMDVAFPGPFNTPFPPGDEDGVTAASPLVAGQPANFTIVASAPGLLDAWLDFDGNGAFDHPGEHLAGGVSIPVVAGPNVVNFLVPGYAVPGTSYARFRISSAGNLRPTGLAPDGEVEDYEVEILVKGSIHGFKYEDVDGDGVYNVLVDLPLVGVEFTLSGTDVLGNTVNKTSFTNALGEFWFVNLVPGDYTVTETVPAGHVATSPISFSSVVESGEELVAFEGQAQIPPGDPRVEIVVGEPLMFGNTVPGSIHGFKYEDVDGDGLYDAAVDQPLAGVEFTLTGTDGQGNVINTVATTNISGEFRFTGLLPSVNGTGPATGYTVVETVPAGFAATTPTAYSTDLLSRQELVAFVGQATLPPGDPRVEVVVGRPLMFGNTVPGSIHGFKYEDVDGNGVYDSAIDLPLAGVEFTLTGTDGQGNVINTTETTDTNGEFGFTGLLPSVNGTGPATGYTVNETVPAGFMRTSPIAYSADLLSRQELVAFAGQANLPPGDPRVEVVVGRQLMFGNTVPGSIHGFKYDDVDGNGVYESAVDLPLEGVEFTLSGTDGQGNVINATETTDSSGEFWFTGLLPSVDGTGPATGYTVDETVPAGSVPTTPTSFSTDLLSRQELVAFAGQSNLPPGDPRVEIVVGDALMFGNMVPGSIHGLKYEDVDGDGIYDAAVDVPLAGVEFTLTGTDGQGNTINTTETTDINGEFGFTGLLPSVDGTGPATGYTVIETVPARFVATTPTAYNTGLLSRQELVALPGQANLPPGDPRVEVVVGGPLMFGNTVLGSIHGFKYEDVDGDGLYDAAVDLPLAGVEFTLTGTDGQGNVINTTETTDINGEFGFTGLLPSVNGTGPVTGYTVIETVPAGFVATTPTAYSTDLWSRQELVAVAGQANLPPGDPRVEVVVGRLLMFGNTVPGSIHGFKYEDVGGNGVYDPAVDLPLAGVEFTLTGTDGQGNVINTTDTTDTNGEFGFTGLLPSVDGTGPATGYTVNETVPAGFVPTTPTSYGTDLLSRQELVAFAGQANLPPGDPRVEVVVGRQLMFGNAESELSVSKEVSAAIASPGETITYTYRVTNFGSLTLSGIVAEDDVLGTVPLGASTLAPDEWTAGVLSYTITNGDLPGPLVNTVVVTGTPPVGAIVTATDTASVTLETTKYHVWLPLVLRNYQP